MKYLYGLKPSVLAWRIHLEEVVRNYMVFTSLVADPDVWFKAPTEKYGNQYCTYILVYVDDILIVDKDPHKFMYMLMDN